MEPKESITLCSECGMCPEVKLYEDHVTIGEGGNIVTLNRREWNILVEKIVNGDLVQI
jgi:hypothetical protein